ncbi:MAG: filamentous hemagglutinin N-terminal domain-containing protein [Pseudomonadota bacterium]
MLIRIIISTLCSFLLNSSVFAAPGGGLIADGTAGTLINWNGERNRRITGGTAQGSNLLHSFQEFNVETGHTVDFKAEAGKQNIVSRVTGANDSWIDGKIQSTTSEVNLYLINPNGIVMGENASLDVKGAFHASTADYITLADGQRVYASPDRGVSLTVAAPEAFGFLDANVSKIQISGSQLSVADDKAISLVGGDITIDAGAKLQAAGGRVDLIGTASAGEVPLPQADVIPSLPVKSAVVHIADSQLQADGVGGGRITIAGDQVRIEDSTLSARTSGRQDGRGIALQAQRELNLTRSLVDTRTSYTGDAGDIQVQAPNITLDMRDATGEVGLRSDSVGEDLSVSFTLSLQLDKFLHEDRDLAASLLDAMLESPAGTELVLFEKIILADIVDIILSDAADTLLVDGTADFENKIFRPKEAFHSLDGETLDGEWKLHITEYRLFSAENFSGLRRWSLQAFGQDFRSTDVPKLLGDDLYISGGIAAASDITSTLSISGVERRIGDPLAPGQAGAIQIQAEQQLQVWNNQPQAAMLTAQVAAADAVSGDIRVQTPLLQVNGAAAIDSWLRTESGIGYFERQNIVSGGIPGQIHRPAGPDYRIPADWGRLLGENLYHHFSVFNLDAWESVTFNGPDTVQHIIARVQGPTSQIEGMLRSAIAGADLWLLNPAGIWFGEHASLDLSGALHLSTADYLTLEDNKSVFVNTATEDLVSLAIPVGFGFLDANIGPIQVHRSQLDVAAGQAIDLVGGEITLELGAELQAPGGYINLIGLGGEITLESGAELQAPGGHINLIGSAVVEAPVLPEVTLPASLTQSAIVQITDSTLRTDGVGGGGMTISGDQIIIQDSVLSAQTNGAQDGRDLVLQADSELHLIRSLLDTRTTYTGHAGAIRLQAPQVVLDMRDPVGEVGLHAGSLGTDISVFELVLMSDHTSVGNVNATLISPSGTELVLFSNLDPWEVTTPIDAVFTDTASTRLDSDTSGPLIGMFRPQESFHMLTGEPLDGEWQLRLTQFLWGSGELQDWSMHVLGQDFSSTDTPQIIPEAEGWEDSIVTSGVTVIGAGQQVGDGLTPGDAGAIQIQAGQQLQVWTNQPQSIVTAHAERNSTHGDIRIRVPELQINGATATDSRFWSESGIGHFARQNIVLTDNSGQAQRLLGPDYQISADWGKVLGDNLYHSFSVFNLDAWESITFNGPDEVQHIIARVYGPMSQINGTIHSAIDGADLWLLNSAGLWFGEHAKLDLSGALRLSTADYLTLADNTRVSVNFLSEDLVSLAAPAGFGFLDASVGQIQVSKSQLTVDQGEAISLVGGEITLDSGALLQALNGHIDLVGVGSAGEVQLTESAIHNTTTTPADITLVDALIHATNKYQPWLWEWDDITGDWTGTPPAPLLGKIRLQGDQVVMQNSELRLNHESDFEATSHGIELQASTAELFDSQITATVMGADGHGADVRLQIADQFVMDHSTIDIQSIEEYGSVGDGGDLWIQATDITLRNGSEINMQPTLGQGGSVNLEAIDQVALNNSDILMSSLEGSLNFAATVDLEVVSGAMGDLTIQATDILLTDVSSIQAIASSISDQNGSIWLEATDQMTLQNSTLDLVVHSFSTRSEISDRPDVSGNSGVDLDIRATDITIMDSSRVTSEAWGNAQSGNIWLEAINQVEIDGSLVFMATLSDLDEISMGGDLVTQAENILITKSIISASNTSSETSQAGSIRLTAADQMQISDSWVTSSSHGLSAGGIIQLQATDLILSGILSEEGSLITSTSGTLDPRQDAADTLFQSFFYPTGDAGRIEIDLTGALHLNDGSQISTSASGIGAAGDIRIGMTSRPTVLQMTDGAIISSGSSSDATGAGDAGRLVVLTEEQILMHDNSEITTESANAGGGGIRVETRDLLHLQNSASAFLRTRVAWSSKKAQSTGKSIHKRFPHAKEIYCSPDRRRTPDSG